MKFEISYKTIDKLAFVKKIKINRQEEILILNGRELNDENIIFISLIKFNQLKDIDLSYNEITNIEPLCNINLLFLELLNL